MNLSHRYFSPDHGESLKCSRIVLQKLTSRWKHMYCAFLYYVREEQVLISFLLFCTGKSPSCILLLLEGKAPLVHFTTGATVIPVFISKLFHSWHFFHNYYSFMRDTVAHMTSEAVSFLFGFLLLFAKTICFVSFSFSLPFVDINFLS